MYQTPYSEVTRAWCPVVGDQHSSKAQSCVKQQHGMDWSRTGLAGLADCIKHFVE